MPENPVKIQFDGAVTLLAGGPCESDDLLAAWRHAPHLVAADGGANTALRLGMIPELVIGDMDSIAPAIRAQLSDTRQIAVSGQDDTDFRKCLDRIAAPLILAVGIWGGRADHTMAAMHVLASADAPCIAIAPHDVIFAVPRAAQLDLPPATRVSLFPLAPVTGRSEGLRWPIDGLTLDPLGMIGTSNRATGPVALTFDAPGMLVVLPRAFLPQAIRAIAT